MSLNWYAARFRTGYELQAARNLDGGRGFYDPEVHERAFCPVERKQWVNRGALQSRLFPVLAGYVFIQMRKFDAYRWHDTKDQKGFLGFIGDEFHPAPVREQVIDNLLARADAEWVMEFEKETQARQPFKRGDCVRIKENSIPTSQPGLLNGVVEWVELDAQAAWVTVKGLFDRDTRAKISISALELISISTKRQRQTFFDLPVRAYYGVVPHSGVVAARAN